MNFYLFKDGKKCRLEEIEDGMYISHELFSYALKNGIYSFGDMPIIDYLDPFGYEIITDLHNFKKDVEFLYSKLASIDLTFNPSFEAQKNELPKLINLIDYAINNDFKISSIGD